MALIRPIPSNASIPSSYVTLLDNEATATFPVTKDKTYIVIWRVSENTTTSANITNMNIVLTSSKINAKNNQDYYVSVCVATATGTAENVSTGYNRQTVYELN